MPIEIQQLLFWLGLFFKRFHFLLFHFEIFFFWNWTGKNENQNSLKVKYNQFELHLSKLQIEIVSIKMTYVKEGFRNKSTISIQFISIPLKLSLKIWNFQTNQQYFNTSTTHQDFVLRNIFPPAPPRFFRVLFVFESLNLLIVLFVDYVSVNKHCLLASLTIWCETFVSCSILLCLLLLLLLLLFFPFYIYFSCFNSYFSFSSCSIFSICKRKNLISFPDYIEVVCFSQAVGFKVPSYSLLLMALDHMFSIFLTIANFALSVPAKVVPNV